MRPTVDEQLAGVDRLLEIIAADPNLGDESALLLRDARRQLGRLKGSLALRAPFLRWDNAASLAVLRALAPLIEPNPEPNPQDPSLQDRIAGLSEPELSDVAPSEAAHSEARPVEAGSSEAGQSEARLAEYNDRLRELLTEVLAALPENDDGEAGRRLIIDHLRARVDANPALNKNPIIPHQTEEPTP